LKGLAIMSYYIYNSLQKEKEEFKPIEDNLVKIYACGPTVYNYAHIGNLRSYIFEDILRKSLKYAGYEVKHVMNITDVGHLQHDDDSGEDKMSLGAKRENKTVWDIARFYEDAFFEDCKKLNIEKPDITCRATDHIQDMIDLIKKLEEKGYTYISNGNVYFEVSKFKDYNKLSNLSLEEMSEGVNRVDVDPNKKNVLDFVLWFTNSKFKNQIMQWDSPWGRGFPGWHIECSAMSMKYLGNRIDMHCGGVDHIPIHHTNEIAQSEAATGEKWVNYWIHGEFLVIRNNKDKAEKMSKSGENFLTVKTLIDKGFSTLDYRFLCIQSRYRKQLDFNFDILTDAKNSYTALKKKVKAVMETEDNGEINKDKINKYIEEFKKGISNDLNVPNSLAVLYTVIQNEELNKNEKIYLIEDFDKVLSLDLTKFEDKKLSPENEKLVNDMIKKRVEAKKNKNWAVADEIRNKLTDMGLEITDTKDGTTWKVK
jgi:cysteinyl-tRNA synthetase